MRFVIELQMESNKKVKKNEGIGRNWIGTLHCTNGEEEFAKCRMHCVFATG